MTDYSYIAGKQEELVRKYETRDPFLLAQYKDIPVHFHPMGSGPQACKGFFVSYCRIGLITINSDLSPLMQKIICAHELGHAILHPAAALNGYHDVFSFNSADEKEKEANLFAAELLMSDGEVLEVLEKDVTFFEAAALLDVPVELLDFKFRVMKWKGYRLVDTPMPVRSDFMKKMTDAI